MSEEYAIRIKNLSKIYKKYTIQINSLKSFVLQYIKYKKEKSKIDVLKIINNLSLDINKGDILCILGFNGAGKSTLAKMIAGTTQPTSGKIIVNGRIVPFLELGVAFNTELTGRDNVYLNGALLGLNLKYIRKHIDEIFKFAEISDFIDTPLKYYSSGMQMRLAFSIGMHANGDIYIFDEILAVGDINFQKKCEYTFKNLIKNKKTIIIITHDMEVIKKYATKVLYLYNGKYTIVENREKIKQIDKIKLENRVV